MTATAETPARSGARALAPDLARGFMLLLIVIANAPWYLWAAQTGIAFPHPVEGGLADRIVQAISLVAIDGRSYPLFAFLFGYGIWQLYRRQIEAGTDPVAAKRLMRRRHAWMLAFGAVHALLLWYGDIVGAYGLAGIILAAIFLDRRDKVLVITAVVLGGLLLLNAIGTAVGIAALLVFAPQFASILNLGEGASLSILASQPDYLLSMLFRFGAWLLLTPGQGLIGLVVPLAILVGIVAARRRILDNPEAHLPLLRRVALGGIAIGWSFGALTATQHLGLWGLGREWDLAFSGFQVLSGLFAGFGYAAVFGLIAARIRTPGPITRAVTAVGKRSLSSYLAQSVIFAPLMSAWGFGLGAALSSWSIALVAIGTWLVILLGNVVLDRLGRRGPAETLLRWLSRPRTRRATASTPT